VSARPPTQTRIFLSLTSAQHSEKYARLPCDGVGLMRSESLALSLGIHPRKLLAAGDEEKFIQHFWESIYKVADAFAPRPVMYRTLNMTKKQYAGLEGGAEYEGKVTSPALDLRGASRYLADTPSFRSELRAVKRARETGCVNLDVVLPCVRTAEELARCREIVIEEGLFASAEFELWMMVEAPANAPRIDEFLPHVTGVSIGAFDEIEQAGLAAMERIARACRARGAGCTLCGEPAGRYPEMIPRLLECGLTGISVAPEFFEATVRAVVEAEASLGIRI
jgi:pyruvate,water dikinase